MRPIARLGRAAYSNSRKRA